MHLYVTPNHVHPLRDFKSYCNRNEVVSKASLANTRHYQTYSTPIYGNSLLLVSHSYLLSCTHHYTKQFSAS